MSCYATPRRDTVTPSFKPQQEPRSDSTSPGRFWGAHQKEATRSLPTHTARPTTKMASVRKPPAARKNHHFDSFRPAIIPDAVAPNPEMIASAYRDGFQPRGSIEWGNQKTPHDASNRIRPVHPMVIALLVERSIVTSRLFQQIVPEVI